MSYPKHIIKKEISNLHSIATSFVCLQYIEHGYTPLLFCYYQREQVASQSKENQSFFHEVLLIKYV